MTSWRSAWRSLRKAAGLPNVRFHDGRHTALTRLAQAGQPDWVIQAQLGHVSPAMMKTYSHVDGRRSMWRVESSNPSSVKMRSSRRGQHLKGARRPPAYRGAGYVTLVPVTRAHGVNE